MPERFIFRRRSAARLVPAYRPTRRAWLIGSLLGGLRLAARAAEPRAKAGDDGSAPIIERFQAEARKAGLSAFRTAETKHFLGIGDSPDRWRQRALEICEGLATTYVKHCREKGFTAVALPERRLSVVTLKDRASYEKFLGEHAGPDVGGHYDLDANALVIYDFRPAVNEPIANAERVNTFTLIHEGIHLLTFNTGLLNREGDVPRSISEGLAMYGEVWRPTGRAPFGQHNSLRRDVLASQPDLGAVWFPPAKLLSDDALFEADETAQMAYAESWALVQYLMKTPARLRGFRAYLSAIQARRDAAKRLDDAARHLGDLDRLDQDLRKYTGRLLEERS